MIVRFWGKKEGFLFAVCDIAFIEYKAGILKLYNYEGKCKLVNRLSYDYFTTESMLK